MGESAVFLELNGKLDFSGTDWGEASEKIVLSNISHGSARSSRLNGYSIRYVARGREIYRIQGRTFRLEAGQFMCAPQALGAEIEIPRNEIAGTLGLCAFLPSDTFVDRDEPVIDAPLVFSARCSPLGALLATHMHQFTRPTANRSAIASSFMKSLKCNLEPLLEDTSLQLESLAAAKKATRMETLRKLHLARAYLHDVTDHAVDLQELALIAGISRFQLLRSFRDCFGDPPAAYHRKLRLGLALGSIEQKLLDCAGAADRYGFAGSSSFSHACRRAFGTAPVRTLQQRSA